MDNQLRHARSPLSFEKRDVRIEYALAAELARVFTLAAGLVPTFMPQSALNRSLPICGLLSNASGRLDCPRLYSGNGMPLVSGAQIRVTMPTTKTDDIIVAAMRNESSTPCSTSI